MSTNQAQVAKKDTLNAKVVTRAEWLTASRELLAKEKEFTRKRDALAAERRALPWEKIEKEYVFRGAGGKKTLGELFGGKSQLIVYHFMFGPEWEEGCPGCSLEADHFNGMAIHLAQRDVAFTAISRAPLAKIDAFKKRMGWGFPWVSSFGSDFNSDFGVSFTKDQLAAGKCYNFGTAGFAAEEGPGLSVFYKDAGGQIFHTYSSYGRGLEDILGLYTFLDRVPKGRDEADLPRPMAWVRHHDRYTDGNLVGIGAPGTSK